LSRVFVDTSANIALLVAADEAHEEAVRGFDRLRVESALLTTTSYVLVETYALAGRRFGRAAVLEFRQFFAPLLDVVWVDAELHERGLDLLSQRTSSLSLVDAVSFACIRDLKIDRAWAFDRHFAQEGFEAV